MNSLRKPAFTLVELLVVIGIIGILVALLLPAVSTVRNAGKRADTLATFNAVEAGLEAYREELDAAYPPSATDQPAGSSTQYVFNTVMTPYVRGAAPVSFSVSGANLLVWALAGADLLGTPGFEDIDGDGVWWNDTHALDSDSASVTEDGLYALDSVDATPLHKRYGPYIDINRNDIVTMRDLALDVIPEGKYPIGGSFPTGQDLISDQRVLLDGYGYPILYYRANSGAANMVTNRSMSPPTTGVYDQNDNCLLTGLYDIAGKAVDLGAGRLVGIDLGAGERHAMRVSPADGVSSNPTMTDLNDHTYDQTFARYIWDRRVTVRNEPVNKETYLLISAGPDSLFGTSDDVTNFK